jgi:hypothetical protein
MTIENTLYTILILLLVSGCGGGSGGTSGNAGETPPTVIVEPPIEVVEPPIEVVEPPIEVVEPPVVIVEPPVVIVEPPVVIVEPQMSKPEDCLTEASDTGNEIYKYITCDGILVRSDIDFPYDEFNTEIALIDLLAVLDTNLDVELDGGTYEEFAQREVDLANKLFADSGVYVKLRLVGVQLVDVKRDDLYRQIRYFSESRSEFSNLDEWQRDAGADIAFLFKKIEDEPIACGVALYNDLTQEYKYRRGVSQCHFNTVFQQTTVTRYYERAHETFTHEIGHILGMDHNIESAGVSSTLFPFSYGHLIRGYDRDLSDEYNGYGTVMSYSDLATGRFSDRSERFIIPENGTSQRLGKDRDGYDIFGVETNPATDGVDHLNRVRYYMSQLHEMFNEPLMFNATVKEPRIISKEDICLF